MRELRPLVTHRDQLTHSIATAAARVAALRTASPQAEALWTHAGSTLQALNWPPIQIPAASVDSEWFLQFQSLRSLVAAAEIVGRARTVEDLRLLQSNTASDIRRVDELGARSRSATQRSAEFRKREFALQRRRDARTLTSIHAGRVRWRPSVEEAAS